MGVIVEKENDVRISRLLPSRRSAPRQRSHERHRRTLRPSALGASEGVVAGRSNRGTGGTECPVAVMGRRLTRDIPPLAVRPENRIADQEYHRTSRFIRRSPADSPSAIRRERRLMAASSHAAITPAPTLAEFRCACETEQLCRDPWRGGGAHSQLDRGRRSPPDCGHFPLRPAEIPTLRRQRQFRRDLAPVTQSSVGFLVQLAFRLMGRSTTIGDGKSAPSSPPRLRSRLLLMPPAGWFKGISIPPNRCIVA